MEPTYLTTGRGGAGNIRPRATAEEQKQAAIAQDLEAQGTADHSQDFKQHVSSAAYTSTGRGGAGNFAPTAGVPAVQDDHLQKRSAASGHEVSGRGGAGNYFYSKQLNEQAQKGSLDQEESQRREIQQAIAADFEKSGDQILQKPERAAHSGNGNELDEPAAQLQ